MPLGQSSDDDEVDFDEIEDEEDKEPAAAEEMDVEKQIISGLIPELSKFAVILPVFGLPREEYESYTVEETSVIEGAVARITDERNEDGDVLYNTQFEGGSKSWLAFEVLIGLDNGDQALTVYESKGLELGSQSADEMPIEVDESSDNASGDEFAEDTPIRKSSRTTKLPARKSLHEMQPRRISLEKKPTRPVRSSRSKSKRLFHMLPYNRKISKDDDLVADSDDNVVVSDLNSPTRPTRNTQKIGTNQYISDFSDDDSRRRTRSNKRKRNYSDSDEEPGYRRSGRTTHTRGRLRERLDSFDEAEEAPIKKPKVIHQKEIFEQLEDGHEFVKSHCKLCDSCGEKGSRDKGSLIHCQGCSMSYHHQCIGTRSTREHLVTKISDSLFVLQCRQCIDKARKRDQLAPHLNVCNGCHRPGLACEPFPPFTTDDITSEQDLSDKINNASNVLFRCGGCRRAYHFDELPPRELAFGARHIVGTEAQIRRHEYPDFTCITCIKHKGKKISKLIAWRTITLEDRQSEAVDLHILETEEDSREYLLIFEKESYFSAQWLPGPWVWGFAHAAMLQAFAKNNPYPKWTTEEAVPEDFLRVEIVFDVVYSSIVPPSSRTEAVDRARIKEVKEVLVKFKGLTYEDSVWVQPPTKDEANRYTDWKKAYDVHVKGNYIHLPKGLSGRMEVLREEKDFKDLELKKQPRYLVGGKLMSYQTEGMNWLYYKWFAQKNAMLADEMGLGKTIQVIAFLSILQHEHKAWPFLIVAPHSTVPNWVREIQKWAPSIRVVAYFGSARARELTRKYELFHPNTGELKCHVVVTSYQTPIDDSQFLKQVLWVEMVVDEGQRLKNEDSQLYQMLAKYKIGHKTLLTGTPLQNNTRELFNLLQFLDPKHMDAERLEEEFGDVTQENLKSIHDLIRQFMLRRTKREALKDLPPISEVIVPVSLTTVQKKLYKSVLANDAELIRAILSKDSIKKEKWTKLNNIMMQLRKVACHPFVYAPDIEDNHVDEELMYRNLVDAGAKLKLLEILLPKLKERGHRVLMFSQFLNMLDIVEDFLDGMGLKKLRLDGSNSTAEKQRLIDDFNAPNSVFFAFLLSTKAGGVGINLATADTVIILDHDFNPHQDMQAISRAHRIGQKNKVLVFHLMTQDCVEERILQIAKKKMSLDHVIIQKMGKGGEKEVDPIDVESILKYGAEAIMTDTVKDITYNSEKIDLLLDRSQIPDAPGPDDTEALTSEASFAFARVWADDSAQSTLPIDEGPAVPVNVELWDKIIAEREAEAARERESRGVAMGRGHRRSGRVTTYVEQDVTPIKALAMYGGGDDDDEDDTDFQASGGESEDDEELVDEEDVLRDLQEKEKRLKERPDLYDATAAERSRVQMPPTSVSNSNDNESGATFFQPIQPTDARQNGLMEITAGPNAPFWAGYDSAGAYRRAVLAPRDLSKSANAQIPFDTKGDHYDFRDCMLCYQSHIPGQCGFRSKPVEYCPLCGIAHFGGGPVCPHLGSETQITAMLAALKQSNEPTELVTAASAYLRSRKGVVQRQKKQKKLKAERMAAMQVQGASAEEMIEIG